MILGMDTSGRNLGLALYEEGRMIGSWLKTTALKHGEILQTRVGEFLKENGSTLNALTDIAITLGPGSFTGLRIGLAAAKGYAFALSIPIAGASTLMAAATAYRNYPGKVCAVIDARREEIYSATFDCRGELPRRISPDKVGGFDELVAPGEDDLLIFGPAALKEKIKGLNAQCEYVINDNYNLAEGVVRLAEIDLSSGRQLDISTAVPSYLRQDFGQA